jgi:hypothetical protein
MKMYTGSRGVVVPFVLILGTFLETSDQLHAPAALSQGKNPGSHWIGGWVGPRDGLDVLEKRIISYPYRDIFFCLSGVFTL